MKNQRAKLVVGAIGLALVVGIGLVIHWYRSGVSPEPPSSFFEPREVQRAIARLESHRLDQEDRLQRCRAVATHIEDAKQITFTNPVNTGEFIAAMRARLASSFISDDPQDQEQDPWDNAFDTFVDTLRAAYQDAEELNSILMRSDWSTLSVPVLERQIVRAKELVASMQTVPLWVSNPDLRTILYPAFEQAYRHRSEQNVAILKSRILAPGPALTRWYYARLLEDRSGLPQPICATKLEEERLSLERTHRDLVQTDAQGVFRQWPFLVTRADHLSKLTGVMRALEQSASLADWLAAAQLQSDALQDLTQQTRAGSATPDPRVRVVLAELEALMADANRMTQAFITVPRLNSLALLFDGLRGLSTKYTDFAQCTLTPLQPTWKTGETAFQSAQKLVANAGTDCRLFQQAKTNFTHFSTAAGWDVTDALLADTFDQWCNTSWPPVSELGKVADAIDCLGEGTVLPALAVSGMAGLLNEMASSADIAQRAHLTERWERRVRPHLKEFPHLVRHVDRSLLTLEQLILEDEFRRLVAQGEEAAIRSAAGDILARPADPQWESLQRAAREILMAIDLSENRDRLDLAVLDQLQQRNPEWIPPTPPENSAQRVVFDFFVRPILDYANAIHRLEAAIGDCAENIRTGYQARRRYRARDPWKVLDDRFLHQVVGTPPPCLPLNTDSLEQMENTAAEILHQYLGFDLASRERLRIYQKAAMELRWLLNAPTQSTPEYRDILTRVQRQVETLGGADDNLAGYLAARERHVELLVELGQATNSFQRMRLIADDRLRPPLDTELEAFARSLRSGLNRLRIVVESDRNAVENRARREPLIRVAADYDAIAGDESVPASLAAYARAQETCLLRYSLPADYSVSPNPDLGNRFTIAYHRLGEGVDALGYGRRFKGRGDDLQVWIRTGDAAVPILRGDWKDDTESGRIRVSNLEAIAGTNSWQWGVPVEIGVRVAHTLNPNMDLVPDATADRSRWNPLNYAVYRVTSNEYTVATFPSLEQLVREHPAPTSNAPRVLLDRVFDPDATEASALSFTVQGIPGGRDFDWPKTVRPQTADELRRLRTDIESSVSNLVDDLLLTP